MQTLSTTPLALAASAWRNRELVFQLVRRDVLGRYRGSFLGLVGAFVQPLLLLAVYAFVFTVIFTPRAAGGDAGGVPYVLTLFAGMLLHGILAESLNAAPGLVLGNPNFVKKTVFPLEVLSLAGLGASVFHALVGFAVLLGFILVLGSGLHLTLLLLPLVLAPLVLLALGVSWLLAGLGVFVRDVSQVTGVVSTLLFFGSPILYPVQAVPEAWRWLLFLNPLTPAVLQTRRVLLLGQAPAWGELGFFALAGCAAAWLGFVCFQKLRPGFADVL